MWEFFGLSKKYSSVHSELNSDTFVMTYEFSSSSLNRELPGDSDTRFVASFGPGKSFFFEERLGREPNAL